MNNKALIAMSGGVDSSVAAFLTKEKGFECSGAIMRLYDKPESHGSDIADARSVCEKLQIGFNIFDFRDEFKKCVIEQFVRAYENALTPNPCIECNKHFKFDRFLSGAKELGNDYIVTGHYARIEKQNGHYFLKKGADVTKDQSYVLYNLTQNQLSRIMFPLGDMSKAEIRDIALDIGFINASKKDSQDICFVPDGDYITVIKKYSGKDYPDGDFVNTKGEIIGKHSGIINYTIGQRKGLGCAFGEKLYVVDKNAVTNTVVLGKNEELFSKYVDVDSVNWIADENPPQSFEAFAKIRYNSKEAPAKIVKTGQTSVRIEFAQSQRAPAKGQSAVIYDGDTVVGGGIIC